MRSLRVAIYARQSKTDVGRVPSTDWQVTECRQACEKRKHTVVATYTDVDLSGYRDVHRPDFERLLGDLSGGQFDAVMAWSIDRLTRKGCWGRDTVELLRGLQEAGIVLFTLEEDYDTSSARGKRRLADDLSRAEEESERISRRSTAGKEAAARRGAPNYGGPRGLGTAPVTDPLTGAKRVALIPDEVALIRSAAEKVLDGGSLRSIVLDWNRRGITTSTGRAWSQQSLRGLLLQHRLVGDRSYRGEVVARDVLPAIIERPVFEGVRAILTDPARRVARPVRSYVLNSVVRCSACGAAMRSNQAKGKPRRYSCPPKPEGCNGRAILAEPLEEFVRDAVLEALDGPALAEALADAATPTEDGPSAAADMRDAEMRLEELARERARGEINRNEWAVMREELQRQIDEARSRMAKASRRPVLAQYAGPGLRDRWAELSVEEQRQVIRSVIDRVTVGPATRGPVFDRSRLDIIWKV